QDPSRQVQLRQCGRALRGQSGGRGWLLQPDPARGDAVEDRRRYGLAEVCEHLDAYAPAFRGQVHDDQPFVADVLAQYAQGQIGDSLSNDLRRWHGSRALPVQRTTKLYGLLTLARQAPTEDR